MAAQPVNITIGASLAASVGASVRNAQSQLGQLGSTMASLNNRKVNTDQFLKLRSEADQLGRAFASAKRHSDELRTAYTSLGPPTAAQAREMQKAESATNKTRTALTRQRDALKELRTSLVSSGADMRDLSNESTKLGAHLEKLQKRTMSLNRAQEAQQSNRERTRQLGGAMVGTAMVGMSMAAPASAAMDFEAQMSRSAAISGATDAQRAAMTAKARQQGKDSKFTSLEAGQAMEYMASANFNPEEQNAAIGGVLDVAAAAGTELKDTADIVSQSLRGFGLAANQAGRVGDVLTKTFISSGTTLESLGETLKYVAPVATQAGASIEFVSAATGVMGDVGIKGSMAGTALRSMFLRMIDPAKAGQKALDKMGISVDQMRELMANGDLGGGAEQIKRMGVSITDEKGNLRDWMDILTELNVKMKNMTKQEKLAAAAAIAGKPGVSGLLAMLAALDKDAGYIDTEVENAKAQGQSEKQIKILRERLEKSSKLQERYRQNQLASQEGTAKKIAAEMMDNTKGALEKMTGAIDDLSISIGDVLLPTVRACAENIDMLASKASVLVQQFPLLSKVVFVGIGGFLALKMATLGLGLAWSLLTSPFLSAEVLLQKAAARMGLLEAQTLTTAAATRTLGSRWADFKIGAKALPGVLRAAAGGFLSLVPAIWATTVALLANPITWAVIGIGVVIAGLAVLIYKYWDPITAYLGGVWTGIKSAFEPLLDVFTPFEPILSAIGSAFSYLGGLISPLIGWIAELISPVQGSTEDMQRWAASGEALGKIIGTVFKRLLNPIILVVEAIGKLIEGVNWLWKNGNKIGASFQGWTDSAGKKIASAENTVRGWLGFDARPEDTAAKTKVRPVGDAMPRDIILPQAVAPLRNPASTAQNTYQTAQQIPAQNAPYPLDRSPYTPKPVSSTRTINNSNNTTFSPSITISAPPGADKREIAELVTESIRRMLPMPTVRSAGLYD